MSSKKTPKAGKGDFKKLIPFIGQYKKATVLTPLFMVGEVAMEVTIPYTMAKIIDVGIADGDLGYVAKVGLLMICMAIFSLCCGAAVCHPEKTAVVYSGSGSGNDLPPIRRGILCGISCLSCQAE